MSYYNTCPSCGAHLDPGEQCTDCVESAVPNKALRDSLHQLVDGIKDGKRLKRLYNLAEYLYIQEDD